ncbi:MAG: hypothetical protein ACK4NZ_07930, partial [Tsuneonella sp.]
MREAAYLSQSRRSRSKDHKAAMAQRRAAERRRARLECLADDRAARRAFRHFKRTMLRDSRVWKPVKLRLREQTTARRPKKKKADGRGRQRLPSIGFDIVDRAGRRGVFLSIQYDGAKGNARGVFRRRIEYAAFSSEVVREPNGQPMLFSNIAATADEAVAIADEIEAFNRSERLNGKVCFNLVIAYPRAAGPREREKIMRIFTQRALADEGVPFVGFNHEPMRDGRLHNPHGHVTASLRPVHREGPYRFLISKDLRVDLDGEEGMARMRRILAEVTTKVMREAGFAHEYTHLSNAARGLAAKPQESLSKEQTEAAKRGEYVAANERNRALVIHNRQYFSAKLKASAEASTALSRSRNLQPIIRSPSTILPLLRQVLPQPLAQFLRRPRVRDCVRVDLSRLEPKALISSGRASMPAAGRRPKMQRAGASDRLPSTVRLRPKTTSLPSMPIAQSLQPLNLEALVRGAPKAQLPAAIMARPISRLKVPFRYGEPVDLVAPAAVRPSLSWISPPTRVKHTLVKQVVARAFSRPIPLVPSALLTSPTPPFVPLEHFGNVGPLHRLFVEDPKPQILGVNLADLQIPLPVRRGSSSARRLQAPATLKIAPIAIPARATKWGSVERGQPPQDRGPLIALRAVAKPMTPKPVLGVRGSNTPPGRAERSARSLT